MAEGKSDTFTFTWVIENFSMCHHAVGECIQSRHFVLNSLPDIQWCIRVYPRVKQNKDVTSVSLLRLDNVSKAFKMEITIQALDMNEQFIFGDNESTIDELEAEEEFWLWEAFERKYLFRLLVNDILVIKCILKPILETFERKILPQISYKDGFFTDLILRADDSVFKVHKAMLSARWPKMLEKLNAEETSETVLDVPSNVLQAMLDYIYTGKLDCSESKFLSEVYAAANKYELPNLQFMPDVTRKARTRINIKKISFIWPIQNFSSLPINTTLYSHIFSVENIKSCKWNLVFHMSEDAVYGRKFDIHVCRIIENRSKPTFVKSSISFGNTYCENEYLFQRDKTWKCAELSRPISINPQDVLLLKCELKFSDCSSSFEIIESSCVLSSSINCGYFSSDMRDLYRSGNLTDISIKVGSKCFRAHKFILSGRSSVFCRMFQTKMRESKKNIVHITDVEADIMDELLLYMYSGYLEKPLAETVDQLYAAADKYDVPALRRKCSFFLKRNLAVGNVCGVLQLAELHADEDLNECASAFFLENAQVVFASREWKKLIKGNLAAKLLEGVISRGKRREKLCI